MKKTYLVTLKAFDPSWTVVTTADGREINVARGMSLSVLTKKLGDQVALIHETTDKISHYELEPVV